MPHAPKVLGYGLLFYAGVATVLGFASGSWHVALHGGFYLSLAFAFWLEARYSCRS